MDKYLYLMLIPGLIYFFVFAYIPMYGLTLAFKDYNFSRGIFGSDWVGLKYFHQLFQDQYIFKVIRNTVLISLYKIVFGFPTPILFALLLNEIRTIKFKKYIQTVTYLPHFISWVVVSGILIDLLSVNGGVVNELINKLGGNSVAFLSDKTYFRSLLVLTDMWKEFGWGAIIYLAALAGIDSELYEAAMIDGAGRFKQAIHISLPGIRGVMIILFILSLGNILNAGFEQILLLYNPLVYETGDILDTYVYRTGIVQGDFGSATAVGLFKSVVAFVIIVGANELSRKFGKAGLY